jgi:hypothetical protein
VFLIVMTSLTDTPCSRWRRLCSQESSTRRQQDPC